MNLKDFFSAQRADFPALGRVKDGRPVVFLDGPAGTQVPQSVIDAISDYFVRCNANHGGLFDTSMESDALLDDAHQAVADFLNAGDKDTIAFGQNMTSLTMAMSRALARTWSPGDEIIVTRLDHDANFRPWLLAAADAGVTVRIVDVFPDDCTLDLDQLKDYLGDKTRLVAVGCASNSVGTVNPISQICGWAREVGALSYVDAVHFAPHRRIDVQAIGCDFLACSAYKFFGPHTGIQWGRRELLEELVPYKLRPASDELPGRWMTGTQSHESIAGTMAAVEYLAKIGAALGAGETRGEQLTTAMVAIQGFESELTLELLAGLSEIPKIRVWGITDPDRINERMPTLSITHEDVPAPQLASLLAAQGIFAWHGNYYAVELSDALGREPEGMVRIGMVHYNTSEEIDRLLLALRNPKL
jgi:cysteine desulfurase family protein (TIGR01976 family)